MKRSLVKRERQKQCVKGSNVVKHAWTSDHEYSTIIDKGNHRTSKTVESWHTAKTVEADNNSCLLPRQYNILLFSLILAFIRTFFLRVFWSLRSTLYIQISAFHFITNFYPSKTVDWLSKGHSFNNFYKRALSSFMYLLHKKVLLKRDC